MKTVTLLESTPCHIIRRSPPRRTKSTASFLSRCRFMPSITAFYYEIKFDARRKPLLKRMRLCYFRIFDFFLWLLCRNMLGSCGFHVTLHLFVLTKFPSFVVVGVSVSTVLRDIMSQYDFFKRILF